MILYTSIILGLNLWGLVLMSKDKDKGFAGSIQFLMMLPIYLKGLELI